MIAKDNKKEIKMGEEEKKVEEVKSAPEVEVPKAEIPEAEEIKKPVADDYQVILDDRGQYKVGDKWMVKVRRINVQEMIMGWGVVSSVFGNVSTMGMDLKDPQSWMSLFVTAIPVVPGKFYAFLAQIMELQYDESLPQKELRKLRDEYNDYLRKDLKTEELLEVLGLVYKQEEERIDDLVKKVQSLFGPVVKMMMEKQKKEQKK